MQILHDPSCRALRSRSFANPLALLSLVRCDSHDSGALNPLRASVLLPFLANNAEFCDAIFRKLLLFLDLTKTQTLRLCSRQN